MYTHQNEWVIFHYCIGELSNHLQLLQLENTATIDDKIYVFAAGFSAGVFLGLYESSYIIALQEIPADTILFAVAVIDGITNAQRLAYCNEVPPGKKKHPLHKCVNEMRCISPHGMARCNISVAIRIRGSHRCGAPSIPTCNQDGGLLNDIELYFFCFRCLIREQDLRCLWDQIKK